VTTTITRLTNSGQFQQLEGRWGDLLRCRADNVFLAHRWLSEWWRVYGPGRELWTLVAEENGHPVAILPLVLERGGGGVRRLVLMGAGEVSPNHLDLLGDAGPVLTEAFCDYLWLHRAHWDVLDLVSVADGSPLRGAWVESLRRRGCDARVTLYTRCAHAALPDSFEEFVQSRGQTTRAEFRRKSRKFLRDNPDARFGVVRDEAEHAEVFNAMVRLHQSRWVRLGEAGIFASTPFTDFHRAASRDALARGALRLYYLRIGAGVAAAKYCYRAGPTVAYYAGGFDEQYRAYSVGIQLLGHVLEQSILEGAKDLDFLQGDESYKEHWSTGVRDNWRVTVAAPHFRGRLAAWGAATADNVRDLWRRHIPMTTRRRVKSFLRGRFRARSTSNGSGHSD
jgi:CelD/BcsL family acetyltransferase involved in cellulose biosynthesis